MICPHCGKSSKLPKQFTLPEWLDSTTWQQFEEMRVKMRKPMTDRARVLIIADLAEFREAGYDPRKVLEQSIKRNWIDVYELKGAKPNVQQQSSADAQLERIEKLRAGRTDGVQGTQRLFS